MIKSKVQENWAVKIYYQNRLKKIQPYTIYKNTPKV